MVWVGREREGMKVGLLVIEMYHQLDHQKPQDVCLPCRGREGQSWRVWLRMW